MEIIVIVFLVLLNGVFSMSETAIISSRKSRLQHLANEGDKNAQAALELANTPSRFLSTTQLGITVISILAGVFGGTTIAKHLDAQLSTINFIHPFSEPLSIAIVVILITFIQLVLGELVPKRLALQNAEKIASFIARPMNIFSAIATPFVSLLSSTTDLVLKFIRIKPSQEPSVSEEEIRMLISEGTQAGVVEIAEKDIVDRTFSLGERKVNSLMTARSEIVWLDIESSFTTIKNTIVKQTHSYYPVCRDSLDRVIGIIRTEDFLTNFLVEEKVEIAKVLYKPLFIPSNLEALRVLEFFKKSGIHIGLIVDEYGSIEGLISLTDILEAIVGDIPTVNEADEKEIVKRDENTWYVDGLLSVDEFKEYFNLKKLPGEKTGSFHTIAGFVMDRLGRIPVTGDKFEWDNYTFEIADMDGNRVDKVLVIKKSE